MKKTVQVVAGMLLLAALAAPGAAGAGRARARPPAQPAGAHVLYLPFIETCRMEAMEETLGSLIGHHPEQQRPQFYCHPTLAQVAHAHAQDMANNDFFGHINSQGLGPNERVRQAGYPLPDFYGHEPGANNIESIVAGVATPEAAFQAWVGSTDHRPHVLGLLSFWAEQVEYGIGYGFNPNSEYVHYWVFISARQGP